MMQKKKTPNTSGIVKKQIVIQKLLKQRIK